VTVCRSQFFAGTLIALVLLTPSQANAKGIILITWGETITHLGDVSAQNRDNVQGSKVGYHWRYVGTFWLDLWTWGGTYCVYEGNTYGPIEASDAARLMGKQENDLQKPFLYRWPLGWLTIFPFVLVCFFLGLLTEMLRTIGGKKKRKKAKVKKGKSEITTVEGKRDIDR
jgi:hypothetical protein